MWMPRELKPHSDLDAIYAQDEWKLIQSETDIRSPIENAILF